MHIRGGGEELWHSGNGRDEVEAESDKGEKASSGVVVYGGNGDGGTVVTEE